VSPLGPDSSEIGDALRAPLSDLGLDLEAVELTPAGHALVERALVADMALEQELVRGLPAGERRQLAELLRRLLLHVEKAP